jgi:4-amino-4-deoxy-L-arabinose transferase-like glycosyltransferase
MKNLKIILFIALIAGLAVRIILLINEPVQVDENMLAHEIHRVLNHPREALPVHFKGFGWGENTLLAYISLPLIIIQAWPDYYSFRIINLIAGLLFLLVTWHFIKKLFNPTLASITALILIIWPWSIKLSTIGYNACLLPLLYTLGLYLFFLALEKKKWLFYFLATASWALSFYAYALSFLWLPLLIIILSIIYHRQINWPVWLTSWITMIIIILPIVLFYAKNELALNLPGQIWFFSLPKLTITRFHDLSIFKAYHGLWMPLNFIFNYLLHFALPALIYLPSHPSWFYLTYPWDIILIIFGFLTIWKNRRLANYKFLLAWLLIGFIPPSFVTTEISYHYLRDIHLLPLLALMSAMGIIFLKEKII